MRELRLLLGRWTPVMQWSAVTTPDSYVCYIQQDTLGSTLLQQASGGAGPARQAFLLTFLPILPHAEFFLSCLQELAALIEELSWGLWFMFAGAWDSSGIIFTC